MSDRSENDGKQDANSKKGSVLYYLFSQSVRSVLPESSEQSSQPERSEQSSQLGRLEQREVEKNKQSPPSNPDSTEKSRPLSVASNYPSPDVDKIQPGPLQVSGIADSDLGGTIPPSRNSTEKSTPLFVDSDFPSLDVDYIQYIQPGPLQVLDITDSDLGGPFPPNQDSTEKSTPPFEASDVPSLDADYIQPRPLQVLDIADSDLGGPFPPSQDSTGKNAELRGVEATPYSLGDNNFSSPCENRKRNITELQIPFDLIAKLTITRDIQNLPGEITSSQSIENLTERQESCELPLDETVEDCIPCHEAAVPLAPVTAVPLAPATAVPLAPVTVVPLAPVTAVPLAPLTAISSAPVTAVSLAPVTAVSLTPVTAVPVTASSGERDWKKRGGAASASIICEDCKESFGSNESRMKHNCSRRTRAGPSGTRVSSFNNYCSMCKRVFKKEDYFNEHILNYRHDKFFQCRHCATRFNVMAGYMQHISLCPSHNKCNICLILFSSRINLRKHKATVHKIYGCAYCDVTFDTQRLLKEHEQTIHPVIYPCFKCTRTFLVLADYYKHLDEHMVHHTNIKNNPCIKCKPTRYFASKQELNDHVRSTHLGSTKSTTRFSYRPSSNVKGDTKTPWQHKTSS